MPQPIAPITFTVTEVLLIGGAFMTMIGAGWAVHRYHCREHQRNDDKRAKDVKALHQRVDGCVKHDDLDRHLKPIHQALETLAKQLGEMTARIDSFMSAVWSARKTGDD